MQGPNVRKLIVEKMSLDAVPSGDGLADAIAFISSSERIVAGAKAATAWVELVIRTVKEAPGDNPYGDDDEAIAGAFLRGLDERRAMRRGGG